VTLIATEPGALAGGLDVDAGGAGAGAGLIVGGGLP